MRQKIKKVLFYGLWLFKFSALTIFYLVVSLPLRFSKKYENLWIISERPDEARDNGYWLYKWILENKPGTNVRFVLDRKSTDYKKMPRKDLIIQPNSASHYICYILSTFSVSTHMHGACPGKSFCIPFLPFMRHKKTVFLQHGVIKDLVKIRGGLDAIIASSEHEKKLIVQANPRYEKKICVTGLCRYDQLGDLSEKEEEKIVLVMPTFRKWLRDVGRLKNASEVFKNTSYFKAWSGILNNKKLNEYLKKEKLELIFFPHKEMQELSKNFVSKSSRVKIGAPGEYDVQNLLRRASLLVTDYSSVFIDFAYMWKPIVFYQFDKEDFFSKHYRAANKPYPFGDIFENENDVVNEIVKSKERNFAMKDNFVEDAKNFYKFRDKHNCERVFNLIKGLKK